MTDTTTTLTIEISAPTASYADSPLAGNITLHAANRDEALVALATLRPLAMLAADKGELTLSVQMDRRGADHDWTTYGLRTNVRDLIGQWLDDFVPHWIDQTFGPAVPAEQDKAAS